MATRGELRQMIADELDDLRQFRCTVASTDANLFRDDERVIMENGTFANRECVAVSGVNRGSVRTVQSNRRDTRTLSFWTDWPHLFAVGDVLDAYNARGNGWRVEQYNRAINRVLSEAGAAGKFPLVEEVTDVLDKADPYVTIPDEFMYLEGVEFKRPRGGRDALGGYEWVMIDPSNYAGGAGWFLDEGTSRVQIGGRWRLEAGGYNVRLIGRGSGGQLYEDGDETNIDTSYVVNAGVASLLRSGSHRQYNVERERMIGTYEDRAREFFKRVHTRLGPNTVKVR